MGAAATLADWPACSSSNMARKAGVVSATREAASPAVSSPLAAVDND